MTRSLLTALAPLACLAAALLAGGCGGLGGGGEDRPRQDATLLLDAPPNAVHAGIYLAAARGFDRGEGVTLRLRKPSATAPLKELRTERVDAAIMDIHELGRARQRGADVIGVMALVQQPLTAVLAQPSIRSPADLAGRRAAISDRPPDEAVLRSVVHGDGGDPEGIRVRVDSDGVDALLAGRVSAATANRGVEGVAAGAERPGLREFRVQDFGAPAYPGLVMVVTRHTLEEGTSTVRAMIRALQRGYREAQVDPESAVAAMREREPRLDRETLLAQLAVVSPAWTAGPGAFGDLRPAVLREWADWAVRFGALRRRPQLDRAFATGLVSRPPAP